MRMPGWPLSGKLWLMPQGGKPIAIGVISATAPIAIKLEPALLAQLGPTAVLAHRESEQSHGNGASARVFHTATQHLRSGMAFSA